MDNYKKDHNLIEGKNYDFKIIKEVSIDKEEYYILETPLKTRMLLPKKPYLLYDFQLNTTINCKVDKISCSGKIYIEPQHPFYKTGEVYPFMVEKVELINNLYNSKTKVIILQDKLQNIITIPAWTSFNSNINELNLRVLRIKKAKLFALPISFPYGYIHKNRRKLTLKIIDAFSIINEDSYYLLEDQDLYWHLLPTKYLGNDIYDIGYKVIAYTNQHPTNNYYYLEPEHPIFKKNTIEEFHILQISTIKDEDNQFQWRVLLKDRIGMEHEIYLSKSVITKNSKTVKLKVGLIRKGKLSLSII